MQCTCYVMNRKKSNFFLSSSLATTSHATIKKFFIIPWDIIKKHEIYEKVLIFIISWDKFFFLID